MRPILLLTLLLSLSTVHAATFKKWVDENGVVHYGTSIPPQYVDREHTELNRRGIEVERVERAKSAEEIAREQELERLRKEQQSLLKEQQARDRVLLNMYRTEDDLLLERDGKLAQVDSQITLRQKQIDRLKERLTEWQRLAADAERRGGQLSAKQQANLDATRRQIETAYASIADKQEDRQKISARYERDLTRLRQLRSTSRAATPLMPESTPDTAQMAEVDGVVLCHDDAECERLWPVAIAYVRQRATMPVQVSGPRILMTHPAAGPTDISLTLSRLNREGVEQLFLDAQCHDSFAGHEFCGSDKVLAIRREFRPYVLGKAN